MKKLFKRKGFLVDQITEDSFYENLLLGLPSMLKTCPFISQMMVKRKPAATLEDVRQWESTNNLRLPEDLRDFFLSTNGFSFTYKFQYDKAESEEPKYILAGVEIGSLADLERINTAGGVHLIEGDLKMLSPYSKVYVMAKIDDNYSVVLAQINPSTPPTIWLYYNNSTFYFLCENFTTYFRMALAHVGVPGWQLFVLYATLPEWSVEMLQILAPGTLNNQQLFENTCEQNKIDCDLFYTASEPELNSESSFLTEKNAKGLKKKTSGRSKRKK